MDAGSPSAPSVYWDRAEYIRARKALYALKGKRGAEYKEARRVLQHSKAAGRGARRSPGEAGLGDGCGEPKGELAGVAPPQQAGDKGRSEEGALLQPPPRGGGYRPRPNSPVLKREQRPAGPYLCEAALNFQFHAGPHTTARPSTITQDMDIDSSSASSSDDSDIVEESDQLSRASGTDLGHSFLGITGRPPRVSSAVKTPVKEGKPAEQFPADTQQQQQLPLVEESGYECRATRRVGEPEGMGPHSGAITALKCNPAVVRLLAAGTFSGTVYVIHDVKTTEMLTGHRLAVADLEWSASGQCLISASLDGTVRIWWVERQQSLGSSRCIRVINEPAVALCVRFAPSNNNIFAVGTGAASLLKFYNLSTGKLVKRHKLKRAATYLAWGTSGKALFLADAGGRVSVCEYDFMQQTLKKTASLALDRGAPVTSLSCRGVDRQYDYLICNVMASAVFVLKAMTTTPFTMTIHRRLAIPQRQMFLRSAFCPDGLSFATGSEDGSVWLVVDVGQLDESPKILKLQGHQGAVLNVAVNEAGHIASGDELGSVMLWECKKKKLRQPSFNDRRIVDVDHSIDDSGSRSASLTSSNSGQSGSPSTNTS